MPKTITKTITTKEPKIKKGRGKRKGGGLNIKSNYQKIKVIVNTGDKDTGKGNNRNTPPYHSISNTTTYIPTPINNTIPSTNTIPTTTHLENAMSNLLKTFTQKPVQTQIPVQTSHPKTIEPTEEQKELRKKIRMKVPGLVKSNLQEKYITNPISQVLRGEEPRPPPQMNSPPTTPNDLTDIIATRGRGRPPLTDRQKAIRDEENRAKALVRQMKTREKRDMRKSLNEMKKNEPELYK